MKWKEYRLWILAFLVGVICICAMRYIEKTLYGGIIETNWMGLSAVWIGTGIGLWLRRAMGGSKEVSKGRRLAGCLLAVIVVLLALRFVYPEKRMWIAGGQLLALVVLLFVFYRQEAKNEKNRDLEALEYLVMFVVVAAVTFAMPKAMGFITTKEAEAIVTEEGCTEAEYLGWMYDRWVFEGAEAPLDGEKETYYLCFGRKDGEPWRFVIDPDGGEILVAAAEKEEPELADWYRYIASLA